jgi:regulator of sirC expression with transglutaminase-like and TPR domain
VKVLQRLRQLQPDDPYQQRDLGVSLLHAGRPGPAIDHLETFLSVSTEKDESEAVQRLLERARAEVSRWN